MNVGASEPDVHQWGSDPDFQGPRHELRERLLLDELLAASPGPAVLDVGAGSGTFRNPEWFSQSDRWAGHVRRYTREELERRVEAAGFEILTCKAWGFPVSALYHRTVFERMVGRRSGSPVSPTMPVRAGMSVLAAALRLDRLFVGYERGALGYLLVARRRSAVTPLKG